MKEKSDSFIFYSTAAGSERGGDGGVVGGGEYLVRITHAN